jgi:hypothetical protein
LADHRQNEHDRYPRANHRQHAESAWDRRGPPRSDASALAFGDNEPVARNLVRMVRPIRVPFGWLFRAWVRSSAAKRQIVRRPSRRIDQALFRLGHGVEQLLPRRDVGAGPESSDPGSQHIGLPRDGLAVDLVLGNAQKIVVTARLAPVFPSKPLAKRIEVVGHGG